MSKSGVTKQPSHTSHSHNHHRSGSSSPSQRKSLLIRRNSSLLSAGKTSSKNSLLSTGKTSSKNSLLSAGKTASSLSKSSSEKVEQPKKTEHKKVEQHKKVDHKKTFFASCARNFSEVRKSARTKGHKPPVISFRKFCNACADYSVLFDRLGNTVLMPIKTDMLNSIARLELNLQVKQVKNDSLLVGSDVPLL